MKNNNNGYTLIEGLLSVIALSLVIGVGYYVYNTNDETEKVQSTSQMQQANEAKSTKNKIEYFEIKELGVKLNKELLPPTTTYKNEEGGTDLQGNPNGPVVLIMNEAFKKTLESCSPKDEKIVANMLLVYKVNGTHKPDNPPANSYSDGLFKQFDDFYLEGTSGPDGGYCINDQNNAARVNQEAAKLRLQIKEAFKNAQKL